MVLRRYVEYINSSTRSAEEITALFGKAVRLANSLLRPCTESPVPCHAEMMRYLIEVYPFFNDVEGGLVVAVTCSVRLNGLVCDFIIEAMSNTESQTLAATVDLLKQDTKSNFVMKLALGTSLHSYVFRPPLTGP